MNTVAKPTDPDQRKARSFEAHASIFKAIRDREGYDTHRNESHDSDRSTWPRQLPPSYLSAARGEQVRLLFAIWAFADGGGRCWASQDRLAWSCGMLRGPRPDRRRVRRILGELVDDGYLIIDQPGGGRGKPTVYRLTRPSEKGAEFAPVLRAGKRAQISARKGRGFRAKGRERRATNSQSEQLVKTPTPENAIESELERWGITGRKGLKLDRITPEVIWHVSHKLDHPGKRYQELAKLDTAGIEVAHVEAIAAVRKNVQTLKVARLGSRDTMVTLAEIRKSITASDGEVESAFRRAVDRIAEHLHARDEDKRIRPQAPLTCDADAIATTCDSFDRLYLARAELKALERGGRA